MDPVDGKDIHETRDGSSGNAAGNRSEQSRSIRHRRRLWRHEDLTWELYRDTLMSIAEQGVGLFRVHHRSAGRYLPAHRQTRHRPSCRAADRLAKWCSPITRENFLYTRFRDICEIMRAYECRSRSATDCWPGRSPTAKTRPVRRVRPRRVEQIRLVVRRP